MELPKFKYFPDPIKVGSIKNSTDACQCCEKQRGYIYTGTMYTSHNVDQICPWCIADGSAAEKYDGCFNSFGTVIDKEDDPCDVSEEVALEISTRTPGFATYQEEEWQFHCNDGCELHGLATVGDMRKISDKEKARVIRNSYLDDSELQYLLEGDSSTELDDFFKFKCLHCGETRLMLDLE